MIALIQDKLVNQAGCDAIKSFLADGGRDAAGNRDTLPGSLVEGVQDIAPPITITKSHSKGGALGILRCDVAYIESAGKKYAIVAQGLLPRRVGTTVVKAREQGMELAKAIHGALP
jgi:hypothetical protein